MRRGDDSCSYTCALRVLTEIVGVVFGEHKTTLKELEGTPIVPFASVQPSQYMHYNGPPPRFLGMNNNDLLNTMEEDQGYQSNEFDNEFDND